MEQIGEIEVKGQKVKVFEKYDPDTERFTYLWEAENGMRRGLHEGSYLAQPYDELIRIVRLNAMTLLD